MARGGARGRPPRAGGGDGEALRRRQPGGDDTPFERTRIRDLQKAVPHLAEPLRDLESRLIDLHPVIRDHVYHPDFHGSFSLKDILHPLVPHLTYDDSSSWTIWLLVSRSRGCCFVAGKIRPEQRDKTRQDLLDYCERDTEAMVELLERLRER